MIKSYLYNKDDHTIVLNIDLPEMASLVVGNNLLLWIDVYNWNPDTPHELKTIAEIFGFHPLAIEDCIHESPRSKVDTYEGYDFFELHALKYDENAEPEISIEELNIFIGRNFIVTVHKYAIPSIGRIAARTIHDNAYMEKGPDYLLYSIVDGITDTYFPIIDRLSARIDELEDEMYEHPALPISEEFLSLKRTIVLVRKAVEPQRRIFANYNLPYTYAVTKEFRPYYMDLSDHLERIMDSIETFRDLVQGALDTYSSLGTAKTNETMRALTIITTLTATLTFITGIFGMNVPLPFQHSWMMTLGVILFMVVMTLWMFFAFKKRKWM